MQKLLKLIGKNSMINYLGFLLTLQYYDALKRSDICCPVRINSLFSNVGFPFNVGEFLAAGKAIIATNVGDVPLYLFNGINGLLIPPESTEAISDALAVCLENKNDIRKKPGGEAKKTAYKYFDSAGLSRKLLEIF